MLLMTNTRMISTRHDQNGEELFCTWDSKFNWHKFFVLHEKYMMMVWKITGVENENENEQKNYFCIQSFSVSTEFFFHSVQLSISAVAFRLQLFNCVVCSGVRRRVYSTRYLSNVLFKRTLDSRNSFLLFVFTEWSRIHTYTVIRTCTRPVEHYFCWRKVVVLTQVQVQQH